MQDIQHANDRKCVCDSALEYHASEVVVNEQKQRRIEGCTRRIMEWCNTKDHKLSGAMVNPLYIGIEGIDADVVNDWIANLQSKGYTTEQANGTLMISF